MTAGTKAKAHWGKGGGPLPSPPTRGWSIMSCISKRSPLTTRPSPLPLHKGGEWLQPTCAHISKQDGTTECDAIFIYVCTSEGGCPQCPQSSVRFSFSPLAYKPHITAILVTASRNQYHAPAVSHFLGRLNPVCQLFCLKFLYSTNYMYLCTAKTIEIS